MQGVENSNWGPAQRRLMAVHPFIGARRGVNKNEEPYVNTDGIPLLVLMLHCTGFARGTKERLLPATLRLMG
jgi:hypothetical protein